VECEICSVSAISPLVSKEKRRDSIPSYSDPGDVTITLYRYRNLRRTNNSEVMGQFTIPLDHDDFPLGEGQCSVFNHCIQLKYA
jgi:hypothetical protein